MYVYAVALTGGNRQECTRGERLWQNDDEGRREVCSDVGGRLLRMPCRRISLDLLSATQVSPEGRNRSEDKYEIDYGIVSVYKIDDSYILLIDTHFMAYPILCAHVLMSLSRSYNLFLDISDHVGCGCCSSSTVFYTKSKNVFYHDSP